jgi:ArsR family transcriptional regulator
LTTRHKDIYISATGRGIVMTPFDTMLSGLKAAADPSRLRLLAVCAQGEWTVSELTQVLGQSQPRISRHLRLLAESGLVERFREGSWVFYRRARDAEGARLAQALVRLLPADDAQLARDRQRLDAVRAARRAAAERWFDGRAEGWDSERDLGVDGAAVDALLISILGTEPARRLLDIGTGTGHVLRLLARHVEHGLGIDLSHDMLKVARVALDRRHVRHCEVRHGDMHQLPLADASFDAVTIHQVLHFADDPAAVLAEARRVLRPAGRLVVVDLAAHEEEWLRAEKRHRRLGFSAEEMAGWLGRLGLVLDPPMRLDGERLAVMIWKARAAPIAVATRGPHERRSAA